MDIVESNQRSPRNGKPEVAETASHIAPASAASHSELIRAHLERILRSPGFHGTSRRARLLRYLVEQTLEERGDALKESVIATQVFERTPDYDPRSPGRKLSTLACLDTPASTRRRC
jgi:hypothetical protein